MYQAELHLQQEKECVLTDLAREVDAPLDIEIEELHDHNVTFVLHAGERADSWYDRLAAADAVHHLDRLDDEALLVTKHSCGAYAAVSKNHGVLRRVNRIGPRQRVYHVLVFNREDLKAIIEEFRSIGLVTLGQLTEFGGATSSLTTRQREVIETALEAGYFRWPREVTSEELAADLGISRPTFLEHLRKAEATLLTQLLDESDGRTRW
ncbi:helix-turn-helix domain-containing protein [Halomarina pelagica]|uniref:helix-turn-helix domain-containing protein n=1 Tax=Halomarina pelagica TaxID=2961599 RepID=UPI0020C36B29|nr:helix-turn-helix domain-containing protein [Halomarina sp. BND7]